MCIRDSVYTCEKGDAYQKVEGTVTKDTTEAKPGVAGKTVYSALSLIHI